MEAPLRLTIIEGEKLRCPHASGAKVIDRNIEVLNKITVRDNWWKIAWGFIRARIVGDEYVTLRTELRPDQFKVGPSSEPQTSPHAA